LRRREGGWEDDGKRGGRRVRKGELDEEGVECESIMKMERKTEMVKETERW